ncbi:hypothetical protein QTP86_010689 [Hemibagrus guttatus]|nr:hypothetical protein QTP86_010689 [Hemibagrus guttatus]
MDAKQMRYIVIWDNVSFHRSALVQNWFHDHPQFSLQYLPPYSPFLNPIEEFFSAWRRKVYDLQPYVRIPLIQAMEEACDLIDAGSVQGWIRHSRRFFARCLAREDITCDVDEVKISARIKGKVYRTAVRPAMLYGLETVSLRKRQESELEVAELKMLRFSLGVTRLDRIRNEYSRGTAHVGRLRDKVREARLRWFGHVQRRETLRPFHNTSHRAFSPGPPPPVLSGADSMRKSLLIYTQQLRRREALLIGVAAADLANFTCHGNLGVKIDSQKLKALDNLGGLFDFQRGNRQAMSSCEISGRSCASEFAVVFLKMFFD